MNWGNALLFAEEQLSKAGILSARQDARMLLAHHLDQSTSIVMAFPERELDQEDGFHELLKRRKNFEPVSHILGQREFWSLPFKVTKDVLDPRPDSETLIEAILERVENTKAPRKFIDFGTGSGCLLLSLLSEYPSSTGVGVDVSEAALSIAKENAVNLKMNDRSDFTISDWSANITDTFDILLSNPPYITTKDMTELLPDVSNHEPHLALHGGDDGLAPYKELIPAGRNLVVKGGLIAFEFGYQQADDIADMMKKEGYSDIQFHPDLSGIIRCITAIN